MAIELSIDGRNQQGRVKSVEIARGGAVVRIFARLAAMAAFLGRSAQTSMERIRTAQVRVGKRKQMEVVESLPLGNRRQLMLVVCDKQRYLVGAGADSVGSILAVEAVPVSRDRAARGPELVRHRGRDARYDAGSRSPEEPELDLWD
jgi:flagellar biogenesis protein FliO